MSERDFPLFYFATIDRPNFLDKHNFYVTEAITRLFAQFRGSDLEAEAQQKEQDYYEAVAKHFAPDYDDEGGIWEQAHNEGISHWLALSDMKNRVSLALTAGMFHQFDKELREKCIREFSHWLDTKTVASMIWNISFPRLIEILEWIGMDITIKAYYRKVDVCRQVVMFISMVMAMLIGRFPPLILSIIRISMFQQATGLIYVMSNLSMVLY